MKRLLLAPLLAALLLPASAKPLNVVFFLVDDLGVMDVSPYNAETFYPTPHVQKLADTGTVYQNPIPISTTTVVRSIAYDSSGENTAYRLAMGWQALAGVL